MSGYCVLGIDPGRNSGATLLDATGRVAAHRQVKCKEAHLRGRIVCAAVKLSLGSGADLIIVRERWQAGGKRANPKMLAGLGAAWGQWQEQIYLHAPYLPTSRIHGVYPSTWKRTVLSAHAKDAAGWLKLVHLYVEQRFKLTGLGDDEAVSICIGCYGLVSTEVKKLARPKPRWHKMAAAVTALGRAS